MKGLANRIERLEASNPLADLRALRDVERSFWNAVAARAAEFPLEAASMSEAERVASLTPVEHLAWCRRFTGEADLERIMGLHGWGAPKDWLGFAMALSYAPGDEGL